ncbi:DUF4349 domain-containing protein [Spartinivicinus poritis]|uniref:DUF4349 domain-containing protein n=1 Tax=Spartinivicinus poritis TaxID=2994640 RepID=A0ABT5UD31_9GAMM|nr:DUF4349 domain-containing protein [Spartinivicinus sp. A2-2]MDE1464284.1 DUF4349 domain-containing protein [Spartinivicinus sp. A2-2]
MSIFRALLSVVLFVLLAGCASTGAYKRAAVSSFDSGSRQTDRFIIKSADIELDVKEPTTAAEKVKEMVVQASGYIGNIRDYNQEDISMTVKVPERQLELFVDQVSSLGNVTSKSFHSEDVTEEIIDIEAKIANLSALRKKFRALLNKATEVSDILKIEKELSRIQTELDSIEGRRKALKNQVVFSKVDIALNQETIYGPLGYLGKGFIWVIGKLFVIK